MSQHDFFVANQRAVSARTDINYGLQALASNSSGPDAPLTTYANMFWYDTTNNILKLRDETDSSWISVAYINQSTGVTSIIDNTLVVSTGGSTTGLLGDQLQSTWNTGTGTTESLVSPVKLKSAILALTPPPVLNIIAYARVDNATSSPLGTTFDSGFATMIRTSQGQYTFTFSSARNSLDYMVFCQSASSTISRTQAVNTQTTSGFDVDTRVISSGGTTDEDFNVIVYALPS